MSAAKHTCFRFFFFILFYSVAPAQEASFLFHRLTRAQNLTSQNYNNHIFKDSEGFVWINSIDGLNRFDGKQVKQYLPVMNDTLSLADGNIQNGFFEDAENNLWFSTVEAIHCYERKKDSFRRLQTAKDKMGFSLLFYDTGRQQFWAMLQDRLFIFSKDQPSRWTELDTLKDFYSYAFKIKLGKKEGEFTLAMPMKDGWQVRVYQQNRKVKAFGFPGKKHAAFGAAAFHFDGANLLWVGTDTGLVAVDLTDRSYKLFNRFREIPVRGVCAIAETGPGQLIVATRTNGIFYFDKNAGQFTHQFFSVEDGSISPFLHPVSSIYLDPGKNLWVSSPGRGVYYTNLHKRKFKAVLQNRPGMDDDLSFVRAMAEDKSGRIWCLTRGGVVVLDENGDPLPGFERFYGKGQPFAGSDPFYIFCDDKERVWVCVQSKLFVLHSPNGNFQNIPVPEDSPRKEVGFNSLAQLANKRILVSSSNAGMFEVVENAGKVTLRPMRAPGLAERRFAKVFEDRQGHLIFNQLWDSLLIYVQSNAGLIPDTSLSMPWIVNAMTEDQLRKTTWVATSSGLFRLANKDGSWTLSQDTVFPFPTINGLLVHKSGDLWASTNVGLVRYQPDSMKYKLYSLADGLQSFEYNFWSFLETRKGLFAFGGVNGLNIFFPEQINDLPLKTNPVITSIIINDQLPAPGQCALTMAGNITQFKKIILPYRQNTLSFRFAALEYSDPTASQFQYMMENADNDWVPAGTDNFTRYANLREGHYVFKLRASNSDGVWQDKITSLEIVIRPPWYRTWQFFLSLTLLILSLIYGIYRYRVAQIREKAELNTRVAENKMAALRSQMNPHFIFNSLQTVNGLITRQELRGAIEYIHQFAKLMRVILENSRESTIPLEREIELLELYMKIEARRLSQPFTFNISAGKEVNTYDMEIPSMLLQPFVENAIKHGIFHKKGPGHINIAFLKENGFLKCVVEDNGVGRAKSAELNAQQGRAHKSRGLQIVKERLQIIRASRPGGYDFEISDLFDLQHNPAGTRVEVRLPLS